MTDSSAATEARWNCSVCGAANPAGAIECQTCGEPRADEAAFEQSQTSVIDASPRRTSVARDYLLAGLGAVILTLLIWALSKPDEAPLPPPAPAPGAQQGNLPPGHPSTSETEPPVSPAQLRAIDSLQSLLQKQPNDSTLKLRLANELYDARRFPEAAVTYRDYLRDQPNNTDARTDMAAAMAEASDIDGAVVELKRVVKALPKHQKAMFNLALMYAAKRDRDSMTYWLKQVVGIDSTSRVGQTASEALRQVSQAHTGQ